MDRPICCEPVANGYAAVDYDRASDALGELAALERFAAVVTATHAGRVTAQAVAPAPPDRQLARAGGSGPLQRLTS
jgi:hypothetical protein